MDKKLLWQNSGANKVSQSTGWNGRSKSGLSGIGEIVGIAEVRAQHEANDVWICHLTGDKMSGSACRRSSNDVMA
jgi:hypothetical protein